MLLDNPQTMNIEFSVRLEEDGINLIFHGQRIVFDEERIKSVDGGEVIYDEANRTVNDGYYEYEYSTAGNLLSILDLQDGSVLFFPYEVAVDNEDETKDSMTGKAAAPCPIDYCSPERLQENIFAPETTLLAQLFYSQWSPTCGYEVPVAQAVEIGNGKGVVYHCCATYGELVTDREGFHYYTNQRTVHTGNVVIYSNTPQFGCFDKNVQWNPDALSPEEICSKIAKTWWSASKCYAGFFPGIFEGGVLDTSIEADLYVGTFGLARTLPFTGDVFDVLDWVNDPTDPWKFSVAMLVTLPVIDDMQDVLRIRRQLESMRFIRQQTRTHALHLTHLNGIAKEISEITDMARSARPMDLKRWNWHRVNIDGMSYFSADATRLNRALSSSGRGKYRYLFERGENGFVWSTIAEHTTMIDYHILR